MSLVLLAAGCGDSEEAVAGAGTRPTPPTCSRPTPSARRPTTPSPSSDSPSGVGDLPAYAKQAAAIVSQERDDLKALQAAPGDEVLVRELGSALDDVVRVANGLVKVAAGGNAAAINDFVKQNGAADERAKALAKQLGMKVCAASE